jgi:hypothetical protein
MALKNFHILKEVQAATGESRHLINFLMRDRQIPFRLVGKAKVLDEEGVELLKRAIAEYRAKPEAQSA